jgi:hypothetical protein
MGIVGKNCYLGGKYNEIKKSFNESFVTIFPYSTHCLRKR